MYVFAFATGGCGGSRCRHLLVRHGDRDTRRVIYLRTACVCVLWCHFGTEVFKRSGVIFYPLWIDTVSLTCVSLVMYNDPQVDRGSRVGVVGSLQIDQWADKETGEPRIRAKVVVRDLDILESRAEAEARRSKGRGPSFYSDDDERPTSQAGSGGFFS